MRPLATACRLGNSANAESGLSPISVALSWKHTKRSFMGEEYNAAGAIGVGSGGRLQVHARSHKDAFVSESLLDHYNLRPAHPSVAPTHSLFLPLTDIIHHAPRSKLCPFPSSSLHLNNLLLQSWQPCQTKEVSPTNALSYRPDWCHCWRGMSD